MVSPRKMDGNDMKGRFRNLIEGLVTTAIILVLIQTIAEDVLVLSGASWMIRRIFLYTGFAFDLFFTVEFLVRSWDAITERRAFGRYLVPGERLGRFRRVGAAADLHLRSRRVLALLGPARPSPASGGHARPAEGGEGGPDGPGAAAPAASEDLSGGSVSPTP
jgi:hypothetical protein